MMIYRDEDGVWNFEGEISYATAAAIAVVVTLILWFAGLGVASMLR